MLHLKAAFRLQNSVRDEPGEVGAHVTRVTGGNQEVCVPYKTIHCILGIGINSTVYVYVHLIICLLVRL